VFDPDSLANTLHWLWHSGCRRFWLLPQHHLTEETDEQENPRKSGTSFHAARSHGNMLAWSVQNNSECRFG
jgi:hypothetical protein